MLRSSMGSGHHPYTDDHVESQSDAMAHVPATDSQVPLFDKSQPDQFAPPPVNVFGEFGNESAMPVTQLSEASFQQHTIVDDGADCDVSVSPDGKWLLFASTRHSDAPDIYVQKVDGVSVVQLTSDAADDAFPTFSPDGRHIAFSSTRNGNWDVYVMDSDGRNVMQVTSGPTQDLHPSFAPDGNRLVYCSGGSRSGQWELWTVDLNSGEKRMIGYGLFPTWCPNPQVDRIAFQKARQRGTRWFSVWTLDLVDGEARNVTEVAVSSNSAVVAPAWSPDGKRIAFGTIVDPARMTEGRPQGQQDIWTVNADGTNRHRLTDGNGINLSPAWSRDGRVYFISNRGGADSVWSVRADPSQTLTADTNELNNK
jgi:TolB protein